MNVSGYLLKVAVAHVITEDFAYWHIQTTLDLTGPF